jgi:putative peptidoglycan lipid II flippase
VLIPYLRRAGYRFHLRTDFRGAGLGKAGSLARWTVGFVLVNQAAYLVVTKAATAAGRAFPARAVGINAYQNAYLFFMLPHSVITVSLVTALLPSMSAAAAAGRRGEVRAMLSRTLRLVAVALVPASAGLVLLGSTLGGVLFGYGKNGHADGVYIGLLLAAFGAGLVPFACHHVLLRSFYAYEDTRTPFFLACGISAVNAALALGVPPLLPAEWRTLALAASYAVTYWIALALTASVAARRLGGIDGSRVLRTYVRVALAALLAAAVAGAALAGLRAALGATAAGAQLVELAVAGLLLLLVYLVACRRMHVREVPELVGALASRGA